MIKIGIMGTQGTGKTTLAYNLAAKYKNEDPGLKVNLAREVARDCPFPINQGGTLESQGWIFHRQMLIELEDGQKSDVLICDRTMLDSLTYAYYSSFYSFVDMYLPIALNWLKTYDKIIWLRPNYAIIDDGERDSSEDFQTSIDKIFAHWIEKYGIKYVDREMCVKYYEKRNDNRNNRA